MDFSLKLGIIIYSLVMVQCAMTTGYMLFKAKKTPTLYCFLICQVLVLLWVFFAMIENMATSTKELLYLVRFTLFPICFSGAAWFIFTLFYTGSITEKNKKAMLLILIPPVISYAPLFTNKYLSLFIADKTLEYAGHTTWGPFFWLHIFVTAIYCVLGAGIILIKAKKQSDIPIKQAALLVAAGLIPHITSSISYSKIFGTPGFDITPVSFSLTFLLFFIATYRYKFMDVAPAVIHEVFESMNTIVVITDNRKNIIAFNNAFGRTFGNELGIRKNDCIDVFLDYLSKYIPGDNGKNDLWNRMNDNLLSPIELELNISTSERKVYHTTFGPVLNEKKEIIGRVFSLKDISAQKNLLYELNEKNTELTNMNAELVALNEQLKDYSTTIEQLAVEKERNRFARELHDTMGHTMTLLLTLLKVIRIDCIEDPQEAKHRLSEAIEITQGGLIELRHSIEGLAPEKLDERDLIEALQYLIRGFEVSGMNIEFSVNGAECITELCKSISFVIYRICQEALTNSVRHSNARKVFVSLKANKNEIRLYIIDNGKGCLKIVKNKGLSGMEERVHSVGGHIVYGSGDTGGFNIKVIIPRVSEDGPLTTKVKGGL